MCFMSVWHAGFIFAGTFSSLSRSTCFSHLYEPDPYVSWQCHTFGRALHVPALLSLQQVALYSVAFFRRLPGQCWLALMETQPSGPAGRGQVVLPALFRRTCVGAVRAGWVLESPALWGETSGSFRVNKHSVLPNLVNMGWESWNLS